MTDQLDRPVVCPVLVGRAIPLETLKNLLSRVQAGHGGTLLISGEAGIGKTRLAGEAGALAQGLGLDVQRGVCFESDRLVLYAPVLDLLRSLVAGQRAEELGQVLAAPSAKDWRCAEVWPARRSRL